MEGQEEILNRPQNWISILDRSWNEDGMLRGTRDVARKTSLTCPITGLGLKMRLFRDQTEELRTSALEQGKHDFPLAPSCLCAQGFMLTPFPWRTIRKIESPRQI